MKMQSSLFKIKNFKMAMAEYSTKCRPFWEGPLTAQVHRVKLALVE